MSIWGRGGVKLGLIWGVALGLTWDRLWGRSKIDLVANSRRCGVALGLTWGPSCGLYEGKIICEIGFAPACAPADDST